MTIQRKLGNNVSARRKEIGMSQEKLSLKADVDRTYVSRIEKGNANISIGILEKLSLALSINASDLLK